MNHEVTRAAEIQRDIRRVLYREWDPIGVAGSAPEDEYDAYIGPVYRILAGSRSERELADYLFRSMRDTMGIRSASLEQVSPIARRLLELDVFWARED